MSWKKERDLLIAQALAFVQSVSAKKDDDGNRDTESDVAVAPIGAITDTPVEAVAIEDPIKIAEPPKDIRLNIPVERMAMPNDIRTEIQGRIASFRAHQERFHREREAYFSATLAKARTTIADGSAPPR
jgi:hypothetical protein